MNSGGAVGIRTPHLRLRLVSVEHFPQLRRSLRNRRMHLALQRRQPFNIGFDVFHLLVSRQRVREDETPAFLAAALVRRRFRRSRLPRRSRRREERQQRCLIGQEALSEYVNLLAVFICGFEAPEIVDADQDFTVQQLRVETFDGGFLSRKHSELRALSSRQKGLLKFRREILQATRHSGLLEQKVYDWNSHSVSEARRVVSGDMSTHPWG